MPARQDPKLLYAIPGIKAYHIQDGQEQLLTPSGPQTLSLLMVPTNSPFADLSTTIPQNEAPDDDFYLHLNLPPELDLPMPATTQIYHQPPTSYLIPRWDLGPSSGAFTKIEFPAIGRGVTQEDVDTFETILAQCTSFLERARPPPLPSRSTASDKAGTAGERYNPLDHAPGGKYASVQPQQPGQIVLIDEDDGSVVGELGGDAKVVEDPRIKVGTKDPVEVQVSPDGKSISVRPMSEDYLRMAKHPAYKDSSMVQRAATASRLIVTGGSYISNALSSGAENFTQKTKPVPEPLEFSPAAHKHVRRINGLTQGAASVSSKTLGKVGDYAQNAAAHMSGHKKARPAKGYDDKGDPLSPEEYRPSLLNKSMIAFTTIADGIAYSGKNLLTSGAGAASTMVAHRYGEQAGSLAADLAGGVKNVGLVYIDVTGVSRRAVIKSVAKGMVVGKVRGGGEVVVGGGDGGLVPDDDLKRMQGFKGVDNDRVGDSVLPPAGKSYGPTKGEYKPVGFGDAAPPKYAEFGQKR